MRRKGLFSILSFALVFCLLFSMPVTFFASDSKLSDAGATSGSTGDCTWSLNGSVLTISGNGAMGDRFQWMEDTSWNTDITDVIVSEGVTSIGRWAFSGCESLTNVSIGASVTSIGDFAFEGCKSLTSINIPDSVTSIGRGSFENCTSLTSILFPNSLTNIDMEAFAECVSLTNVKLPDSVASIGSSSFRYCTNLVSVTFGKGLTRIDGDLFSDCNKLMSITVSDTNSTYSSIDGNLYNKEKTSFIRYAPAKTDSNFTIPNSVTSIKCYAFSQCSNLTDIIIPDSITSIEYCAFSFCTNLTNLIIPESVNSIGRYTFGRCISLTNITIPKRIKTIPFEAFAGCVNLTCVTILDGVTSIAPEAFNFCSSLSSITIPASVTTIDRNVFAHCPNLSDVYYSGDRNEWNKISFERSADKTDLESKNIHYNSSLPYQGVTYSLYADGNPNKIYFGETKEFFVRGVNKSAALVDYYPNGGLSWKSSNSDVISIVSNDEHFSKVKLKANAIGNSNISLFVNGKMVYTFTVSVYDLNSGFVSGSLYHNSNRIDGIEVDFNSDWFFNDSKTYNHNLAQLCSQILYEGYQNKSENNKLNLDKWDIEITLNELGFKTQSGYVFKKGAGRDEEDYYIFTRPISKGGKAYHLVFVGCIGSNGRQWNSNFDPLGLESETNYSHTDPTYNNVNHYGFNDAKNYVYNNLADYLDTYGYTKENTIILLTGHSRGAAAANLIGAKLMDDNDRVSPEHLFTYTFATPNCTKNVDQKSGKSDSKYNRIFNIVNPTDFVTKVMPHAWGYGRYGTTYTLPSKNNDSKYSSLKKKMMSVYNKLNSASFGETEYNEYKNGEDEVYTIISTMTKYIKNPMELYSNCYQLDHTTLTPYHYFQEGLCPWVNGTKDFGTKFVASSYMIDPLLTPFGTSEIYKKISEFFIDEEMLVRIKTEYQSGAIVYDLMKNGRFADAHKMETYCAFMMGLSSNEVRYDSNYKVRKGLRGSVNCPVDVEVIDKDTGEVVGRIVNNTVDEEIAAKDNSIVMTVDGDEKNYWLPSNGNYDVRLIGNDDGTMDYSMSEVDSDLGEVNRTNFNDVIIETDKTYTCTLIESIPSVLNESESQLKSLIDENDQEVLPDQSFTPDDKVEYTIETNIEGSGTSTESLTVTSGDYVSLTASPYHSDFLGWYQGDTLLSTDAICRFRPTENIILTAKFTEATFLLGDVDDDESVTIIDATYIQRKLASLDNKVFIDNESDADGDGELTIIDATFIQRWLVQLPTNENIGKPSIT